MKKQKILFDELIKVFEMMLQKKNLKLKILSIYSITQNSIINEM